MLDTTWTRQRGYSHAERLMMQKPTKQISKAVALSPFTVLHKVTLTFRGNDIEIVTDCGENVNRKTWRRVKDDPSLSHCESCFK